MLVRGQQRAIWFVVLSISVVYGLLVHLLHVVLGKVITIASQEPWLLWFAILTVVEAYLVLLLYGVFKSVLSIIRANHVTSSQSDRSKHVAWWYVKSHRAHFAML